MYLQNSTKCIYRTPPSVFAELHLVGPTLHQARLLHLWLANPPTSSEGDDEDDNNDDDDDNNDDVKALRPLTSSEGIVWTPQIILDFWQNFRL